MSMPTFLRARPVGRSRAVLLGLPVAAVLVAMSATVALAQDSGDDPAGATEEPSEPSVEPVSFTDTEGATHADAIYALAARAIVQGCEEDQFCPTDLVTRGQVATMLAGALDLEPTPDGPFDDVEGSVHELQINALHAAGIVNGCEDDAFCGPDPLSREQLASMLVAAFELPAASTRYFDDAGGVHGDSIHRLAEAGLTAGCSDPLTHYCSRDTVTRGQAATFIARALGLVEPVEITPLAERRERQEIIDAERAAAAARQAELEAELEAQRQAAREEEQRAAERLAMWDRLAQCESGGNWSINTGNGYYGGLQFLLQTWRYVGGSGYPHQATKEEQIYRAERLLEYSWASFSNQWPACSRRLGLS